MMNFSSFLDELNINEITESLDDLYTGKEPASFDRQRYMRLMGVDDEQKIYQAEQPVNPNSPEEKELREDKEYRINYREEAGGGYFKVRIKNHPDGSTDYNYGFYNMKSLPVVEIDESKIRKIDIKKYRDMVNYMNSVNKEEGESEEQEEGDQMSDGNENAPGNEQEQLPEQG